MPKRQTQTISCALLCGVLLLLAGCAASPPVAGHAAANPTPGAAPAASATSAPCPACPVCEPAKPPAVAAAPARLQRAAWSDLPGWAEDDLTAVWPALLQSCRVLDKKPLDGWKPFCDEARRISGQSAPQLRRFLENRLQPYAATAADGNDSGLMTGYYEALLNGSRNRSPRYAYPVLAAPEDLLTIDLADLFPELKNKRVRGRLVGNKVVPYWSREEIAGQEEKLPAKPLAWVDDEVELFFLQVQGSGRIKLPDGSFLRVNYADQNGHSYHSIGRILVLRGELKLEEASMQGIQAWARANPGKLSDILNANPSYVFFRPVADDGQGPIGALGVPLTAERSLAVDPRSIPLGAPVFLATTRPNSKEPMNRLMVAQDTGGAIKGPVRADFFWGFGKEAAEQAGKMKQSGRLWVLLPQEAAPIDPAR